MSNMAVKLSVHAVTGRAYARPAPARPAAYGRRSPDKNKARSGMRGRNVLMVVLTLVLVSAGAAASKRVRVPTTKDLATVWVGASPMSVEYLRLELTESGKGILTVQYLPEHPARAYRVTRTTLTKYRVVFEVQPVEPDAAPIYLRGDAIPGHLELEMGGTNPDWKSPVVLEPLPDLLDRIEAVTRRAREVGDVEEK